MNWLNKSTANLHLVLLTLFVALSTHAARARTCESVLIPDVYALNILPNLQPQRIETRPAFSSPAVTDTWLNLGRRTVAYPDFKYISDLEPKNLSEAQKREVIQNAKRTRRKMYDEAVASGTDPREAVKMAQVIYARTVIEGLFQEESGLVPYQHPLIEARLQIKAGSGLPNMNFEQLNNAFVHVEHTWADLARQTPQASNGSLLPAPFPFLVAGGRFREAYYWDAYFGAIGLVETGRWEIAAAQFENLLNMIQTYGIIPNGFRDYYLSRSQPPAISLFAMLIYENAPSTIPREKLQKWMKERVYPLLKRDYQEFWMTHRKDPDTGLNFHSDAFNSKRPERHSNDDESALGETFRDVRGEAESGLDHTDASMGASSQVASVMLNSFMFAYEKNLAQMAQIVGGTDEAQSFLAAAERRRRMMYRLNWDEATGTLRNWHLRDKVHSPVVSAEMFTAMYVGLVTKSQARRMVAFAEQELERKGGLRSSTVDSGKQWDGSHGWAPFHVMAIHGANAYGLRTAAHRWARKWTNALAQIYSRTGFFYEKIDVESVTAPHEDDSKYPTQTGFLWTNASYVWVLKFLGFEFTSSSGSAN